MHEAMRTSLPKTIRLACLLALGTLCGCGYAPPPRTDTASAKYQADYDACDSSVPDKVDRQNAKTGLSWFTGGVTRWSRIDSGMNSCMEAKGWGYTRACTADELRGAKPGSLTVTRDGIRCTVANKGQG